MNGEQNDYGTAFFASSNYWADRNRTAMDDLESLMYTIWSVAGIPMGGPSGKYPEGQKLAECLRDRVEGTYMKVRYEIALDTELHTIKFTISRIFCRKNTQMSKIEMSKRHSSSFLMK